MQQIVDYLRQIYVEGQRYTLLSALTGTLATLNVPINKALEIYSEIKDLDDENREDLIRRTYYRYKEGKKITTLKSYLSDDDYKKLYYLVKNYFSIYEIVEYDDTNLYIEQQDDGEDYIDLDQISIPIQKDTEAYKYLLKRKLNEEDITKYNIRKGIDDLSDYVIFPVVRNGKCVYYTGRNYRNKIPKYKNAKKEKSKYVWFSDEDYYNYDTVIVCEGIINAITVKKYIPSVMTCAVLGKVISLNQVIQIQRFENIIFNFDTDVSIDYIKDKIFPFFEGKNLSILSLPEGKDANDLTREEYIKYFLKREKIEDTIKI